MARADAARNRERLWDAARAALLADGPDASLEAIARTAGVGIATLYRNWPTRSDLVRDVLADRVAALVAAPTLLLASHPPQEALHHWITLFFDVARYLNVIIAGDPQRRLIDGLEASVGVLLSANAAELGGVRPRELLMALGGIACALGKPQDRHRADDLAELLLDGMRWRRQASSSTDAAASSVADDA